MVDLGERVTSYGGNSFVTAHDVELGEPGDDLLEESKNNLVAGHGVELGEPGNDLWELSWWNRVRIFSGLLPMYVRRM